MTEEYIEHNTVIDRENLHFLVYHKIKCLPPDKFGLKIKIKYQRELEKVFFFERCKFHGLKYVSAM